MDLDLVEVKAELITAERFEPARCSIPDLHFLLEEFGTPPAVAMRKELKPGVIKIRVKELLTDVYNLEQIRMADGDFSWAGIEALKDSITRFLEWHDRSLELKRRRIKDATGALITHPSQYSWDEDGRAYKYAVDADSAEMVRTEILDNGERKAFGVNLLEPAGQRIPHLSEVAPWVKSPEDKPARERDAVKDERSAKDKRVAHLICSICDHHEQYDPRNRGTRSAANARMSRHMRTARVNMSRHRILLSRLGR